MTTFVKTGARLKFAADVKSAAKTSAPIKAVYLFDEGYMIDFKTEPPYEFEVPFTKAFYSKTRWGKAGCFPCGWRTRADTCGRCCTG